MVPESILICFFERDTPLNWKEHILHTGSSSNYESILEKGQWAGGLGPRDTGQACFFSR